MSTTVFQVNHQTAVKIERIGKIKEANNGLTYRNENSFMESFILFEAESFKELLEVRVYGKNRNRVCLWLRDGMHSVFQGAANGYGYDKTAGAIQDAFYNAGFRRLDRTDMITSTSNVPEFMYAVAKLLYPANSDSVMLCVHAHG